MKGRIVLYLLMIIPHFYCNSLFYQPDNYRYIDPQSENINFKDFYIESFDKKKIHVWIFPSQKKSRGTILQFHGNAQNMTSHFMSLFWVTAYGYNLVSFDYRGYGESEGNVEQVLIRKDSEAVARFLHSLDKDFLGEKIIFHGQSLGGIILMETLLHLKKEFLPDMAVLESTFYSYRDMAFYQLGRYWATALLIPAAFFLVSDWESPALSIKKLPKIPYLVIHGDKDSVVPYIFGEKVYQRINSRKSFLRIPDGRHLGSFVVEENRRLYLSSIQDLFKIF